MASTDTPDFDKRGGLVTAIAQDHETREILMVAYMNAESFAKTLELGEVVYWSTSRNELWHKGESSGNTQILKEHLKADAYAEEIAGDVYEAGERGVNRRRRSGARLRSC